MDQRTQFPDGYAVAPHWVMRNSLIPPHVKLVYVYLEGRLNEDGVCWPAQTTTATDLGISTASVKRATTWMKDNGLVTVERKSKGSGTFNIYSLPKRLPDHLRPKDHVDLLVVPKDQNDGPKDHTDLNQKVTVIYKEEPLEEEPTEEQPLSRFQEFWDIYDKKTGRKKAETKYHQVIKRADVDEDELIAAARDYIWHLQQAGKHPQFTKDPLTWLNGDHWEDEYVSPPPPQTNMQAHLALVQQMWENERTNRPQLEG